MHAHCLHTFHLTPSIRGVHLRDRRIPQVRLLFEEIHPRFEKLAAPAAAVSISYRIAHPVDGSVTKSRIVGALHVTQKIGHGCMQVRTDASRLVLSRLVSSFRPLRKPSPHCRKNWGRVMEEKRRRHGTCVRAGAVTQKKRRSDGKGESGKRKRKRTCPPFLHHQRRRDGVSAVSSRLWNSCVSMYLYVRGAKLQHTTVLYACRSSDFRAYVPFNRRFSARKPTSCSALLLTRLTMTASFSRP
jgi:hypothetical protein